MSWFQNNNKKIYPTKMFVNYLPEISQQKTNDSIQTKSIGNSMLSMALGTQGVALDMLLTAAPKLIEEGMNFMSKTLESLAIDKAYPTTIRRNFDIIDPKKIFLPSKIILIRGNFAANNSLKGEIFGDGKKQSHNQAILIGNKELHIEIDIIQSEDKSAIYFQVNSYFYIGKSPEGHTINEIVLAFAFLPSGKILNPQKDFKEFLHLEALSPNQQYNFKSKSGYDNAFQSAWINTPLEKIEPYTMVIQIQEIHEGNSFAKLMQTVYIENESKLRNSLNKQVNILKKDKN